MLYVMSANVVGVSAQASTLLDPSLVTKRLWTEAADGKLASIRGVRVYDHAGGEGIHLDGYHTDGSLVNLAACSDAATSSYLRDFFNGQLHWKRTQVPERHFARSRKLKSGHHAAIQCQADDFLSIVQELQTGRFLVNLFEELYNNVPTEKYPWSQQAVSFGAGGRGDDPTMRWVRRFGKKILMVDADEDRIRKASRYMLRAEDSFVRNAAGALDLVWIARRITPEHVLRGELEAQIRGELHGQADVISIDIMSFDCEILEPLLRIVQAAVVVLESQPLIPPPIRYARLFHEHDTYEVGLNSCSLSQQLELLGPNYTLLVYTEINTIFVRSWLAPALEVLQQFRPGSIFPWTSYPVKFPVDELDCFRRARAPEPYLLAGRNRSYWVPKNLVRDWALQLEPSEAFTAIQRFISPSFRPFDDADKSLVWKQRLRL